MITCETPGCDYEDKDFDPKDWEEILDKPCPKCGVVLLDGDELVSALGLVLMEKLIEPKEEEKE